MHSSVEARRPTASLGGDRAGRIVGVPVGQRLPSLAGETLAGAVVTAKVPQKP
jgi:hypothetical protein